MTDYFYKSFKEGFSGLIIYLTAKQILKVQINTFQHFGWSNN